MDLRTRAVSGAKWTAIAQACRQGLQWITTMILARFLLPSDYGLMGMSVALINFIIIFRGLGTSSAIIQRRDISEALLSSLFFLNVVFGFLSMTLVYLLAPLIADFYSEDQLIEILRVLSTTFCISSFSVVHQARIEKEIAFKKMAIVELLSAIVASAAGIFLAVYGFGVWSLVFKSLTEILLTTLFVIYASNWAPKWSFHFSEVKQVLNYSANLTGFNILNYIARNADYIIIGRFLGATDLGYYTLAYRIMFLPIQQISNVIGRIAFPVYAALQDNHAEFRRTYLTIAGYIALITLPMMLGLMVVSEAFVLTLFGPKWKPVALLLTIMAPVGFIQSLSVLTGGIYQAKGHTGLMFKWGMVTTGAYLIAFFAGLRWGINGVALAYALATFLLVYPIHAIPFHLIKLKVVDYLRHLSKPLLCAVTMLAVIYPLKFFYLAGKPSPMTLAVLVLTGAFTYAVATWYLNQNMAKRFFKLIASRTNPG